LCYAFRISISLAILATFSKSYARKQKWLFFSEHNVVVIFGVVVVNCRWTDQQLSRHNVWLLSRRRHCCSRSRQCRVSRSDFVKL